MQINHSAVVSLSQEDKIRFKSFLPSSLPPFTDGGNPMLSSFSLTVRTLHSSLTCSSKYAIALSAKEALALGCYISAHRSGEGKFSCALGLKFFTKMMMFGPTDDKIVVNFYNQWSMWPLRLRGGGSLSSNYQNDDELSKQPESQDDQCFRQGACGSALFSPVLRDLYYSSNQCGGKVSKDRKSRIDAQQIQKLLMAAAIWNQKDLVHCVTQLLLHHYEWKFPSTPSVNLAFLESLVKYSSLSIFKDLLTLGVIPLHVTETYGVKTLWVLDATTRLHNNEMTLHLLENYIPSQKVLEQEEIISMDEEQDKEKKTLREILSTVQQLADKSNAAGLFLKRMIHLHFSRTITINNSPSSSSSSRQLDDEDEDEDFSSAPLGCSRKQHQIEQQAQQRADHFLQMNHKGRLLVANA